jgi:hypothetical protein
LVVTVPKQENDAVTFPLGDSKLPGFTEPAVMLMRVDYLTDGGSRRSARIIVAEDSVEASYRLDQPGLTFGGDNQMHPLSLERSPIQYPY